MPISPRLASARLKGATVKLTIIAVYATTLDAAEVLGVSRLNGFQANRDQLTRSNQCSVKLGRGCTDQIHNLRHTLEQH